MIDLTKIITLAFLTSALTFGTAFAGGGNGGSDDEETGSPHITIQIQSDEEQTQDQNQAKKLAQDLSNLFNAYASTPNNNNITPKENQDKALEPFKDLIRDFTSLNSDLSEKYNKHLRHEAERQKNKELYGPNYYLKDREIEKLIKKGILKRKQEKKA